MQVTINVPDEIARKIVAQFRAVKENETEWDKAKKNIHSDSEIVRADVETLINFFDKGLLVFKNE